VVIVIIILIQVLAEMVNLHFLGLMEALLECQSTILAKLMPLWCPVLQAYNITVGGHTVHIHPPSFRLTTSR